MIPAFGAWVYVVVLAAPWVGLWAVLGPLPDGPPHDDDEEAT